MKTFAKVTQIIKNESLSAKTESVDTASALGRILQEDIAADINMPPFDKSAMDGYACRRADIENELEIVEVIQAGKLPAKKIEKNQCSKIMTGAAIPAGADCVFMLEDSQLTAPDKVKCKNPRSKINICFKGEDYKTGDILVKKGRPITPAHIGTMAGAGYTQIQVSKLPRVAVMASGSELVEARQNPQAGQIRNSNSLQLLSQMKAMGVNASDFGIVPDDPEKIIANFEKSLSEHDLIIITGGASKSDFDFIPHIVKKQGFKILAEKTGAKPGNPMSFSKKESKYCFGLSGNPVSSFVQFELFVKPFLYRSMGCDWAPPRQAGTLQNDFSRKNGERFGIIPVIINEENRIKEVSFHGSAHINALPNANALMEIPEGIVRLKKGEKVYVRRI